MNDILNIVTRNKASYEKKSIKHKILWVFIWVPMVLNPPGIEPIFLKFYSNYNLQCIKLDKERKAEGGGKVLWIQKYFKNGFNPVFGSIPRLPFICQCM